MNELEENQQTVKKSGFGRGLIFGVIAGLSIAILAGVVLLNVFYLWSVPAPAERPNPSPAGTWTHPAPHGLEVLPYSFVK